MGLLAFVPFILLPQMVNWAAAQSIITVLIVSIVLIYCTTKESYWTFDLFHLPWIIWPFYLFLRSNPVNEYFSENTLRLMTMLVLSLLIYSAMPIRKMSMKMVVFGILLLPIVQIIGFFLGNSFLSQNAVFAQENVYQFVNLIAIGYLVWQVKFVTHTKYQRNIMLVIIGLLAFSMFMGDAFNRGKWDISSGDSIGIWLGLACGILAAWGCWVAVRLRIPVQMTMMWALVIVVIWAIIPVVLLQLPFWDSQQNSSITSRIVFWQATWELIQNHFWLGVGHGGYGAWVQNYWPTLEKTLIPIVALPLAAHNHHLHIWAETGFVGYAWSVLLWGIPWLLAIYAYTKKKIAKALFWIGLLAAVQSVMVVLEVTQMFISGQILAWLTIIHASKDLITTKYKVQIRSLWFLLIIPIVLVLSWDRAWQLYSQYYSAPSELMGYVETSQVPNINQAIKVHGKNAAALYYLAELHRENKQYDEALKAIDLLQDISGTQWPIHRMRAEVYHAMGDSTTACKHAQWPLNHSAHKRDQALRSLLHCQ